MIISLNQLTMSEFVELVCGDASVLKPGGQSKDEVSTVRTRLYFDFISLSDPTASSRILLHRSQAMKRKASQQLLIMCHNLVEIRAYGEARELLGIYGTSTDNIPDSQLSGIVSGLIKRIERDIAVEDASGSENGKEMEPDEIRLSYDRQCASLMAYFKFQIDMNTIKASQFACLIDQANREIKARQSALKKR